MKSTPFFQRKYAWIVVSFVVIVVLALTAVTPAIVGYVSLETESYHGTCYFYDEKGNSAPVMLYGKILPNDETYINEDSSRVAPSSIANYTNMNVCYLVVKTTTFPGNPFGRPEVFYATAVIEQEDGDMFLRITSLFGTWHRSLKEISK